MANINVTEKAAEAVRRIMQETLQSETARLSANGGGVAIRGDRDGAALQHVVAHRAAAD